MEELPRGQWGVDPYDRHELRWWDGSAWTEHVLDGSDAGVDPLGPVRPGRVDRRVVLHGVMVVLTLGLSFMAWRAVQSVRGGRTNEARAWTVGGLVWLVLLVSLSDGVGGRPTDVNGHIATPGITSSPPAQRLVPGDERPPDGTAAAWVTRSPSVAAAERPPGDGDPGTGSGADPGFRAGSGDETEPGRTAHPVTTTAARTTAPARAPVTSPTWGTSPGPTPSPTEHTLPTTEATTEATTGPTTGPTRDTVDRRYWNCRAVIAHGLGPYHRGEPEYEWYPDRNGDGVVCDSTRGRHHSWW